MSASSVLYVAGKLAMSAYCRAKSGNLSTVRGAGAPYGRSPPHYTYSRAEVCAVMHLGSLSSQLHKIQKRFCNRQNMLLSFLKLFVDVSYYCTFKKKYEKMA